MTPAVNVKNIWKQFILYHQMQGTLRETLLRFGSVRNLGREKFWALQNISFDVPHGETLGIIGENGSGKTTLLRIILGITPPTKGTIQINGHLSALLELAAGFHPDLTGKENIYLNGAILGLSKSEIADKMPAIIEFAELEKFIDVPIKHYSAGMYLRLGFSIAININPDILLIDEVLAFYFRAPHSYTGEDLVEIQAHGSPLVLQRILAAVLASGAVLAEPGEFTARAVINGRLNLVQAEAVLDLIRAKTGAAAEAALRRLAGAGGQA
ncbi:MAG: ATP-binding cassette domain-containing protein, partial [bacterium]